MNIFILINELKQSFMVFKLIFNSCFIGVKYCIDHVIITELVIRVDRDEMEIKQRIAGEVLGSKSHTSVQIDNGSCAGVFRCVIVGHNKRFDGLV